MALRVEGRDVPDIWITEPFVVPADMSPETIQLIRDVLDDLRQPGEPAWIVRPASGDAAS